MPEQTVALNRRARHDYAIEDTLEAGLVLTGTEIKSIRAATCQPGRGLRPHRARRGVADRRPHRAVRAGKPQQPRADPDAEAAAPSGPDRRAASGRSQAKGLTLVPLRLYLRAASPSWSSASRAARRRTTSGAPSPSATCAASWSGRPRLGRPADAELVSEQPVHIGRRRVVSSVRPIGSWGCQVSTGPRNREPQVEVARRPRKTAGKPVTGN